MKHLTKIFTCAVAGLLTIITSYLLSTLHSAYRGLQPPKINKSKVSLHKN